MNKDISVTKTGRRLGPEAVRQGDTAELGRFYQIIYNEIRERQFNTVTICCWSNADAASLESRTSD